jgi:hypothetical protein
MVSNVVTLVEPPPPFGVIAVCPVKKAWSAVVATKMLSVVPSVVRLVFRTFLA